MSTVILIKPDAFERGLFETLLQHIKSYDLELIQLKTFIIGADLTNRLEKHYEEHSERLFYPNLIKQMSRGPIAAMLFRGTIEEGRRFVEDMREQYALDPPNNTVHGSDCVEAADREAKIWGLL